MSRRKNKKVQSDITKGKVDIGQAQNLPPDIDLYAEMMIDGETGESLRYATNLMQAMKGKEPPYFPDYALALIYHLHNGGTFKSFGGRIGVSFYYINKWLTTQPDFKFAYEIGQMKHRLTWEKILSNAANGQSRGNAAAIIFGLKNYYKDDFKEQVKEQTTQPTTIIINTGIKRQKVDIEDAQYRPVNNGQELPYFEENIDDAESV